MAEYTLVLTRKAEKTLDKLSDHLAAPILKAIAALATNPRPHGYIKLKGREGYRIKAGNYRIIYEIEDNILTITILAVADRKEAYR
ncbi:MAG: type II toxin-antitoxin system RelE/ParE family toxin [Phaeodactylibacter sp.]|nr:type II toxin-antitoxin system RelE/ParE family toxin [Phaeodactylibacter sp.]